jgi:hypothetical protein
MPCGVKGITLGNESSWRDPVDVGAFGHTLVDLHGHFGSGRSRSHSDVIKLHGRDGLLELRAVTTEAQRVSNLQTRGAFHDAHLRLREIVTEWCRSVLQPSLAPIWRLA